MHAYSQDLRDRVLRALERGERPTAIARRFEVSRMWVHRVRAGWQKGGVRGSLPMGGHRRSRLAALEAVVRDWIEQAPDLRLAEACGRLAERGVTIRVPALWQQLDLWGLTFKTYPARQSKSATTYSRHAGRGVATLSCSTSTSSYLLMRRGPRRTWCGAMDVPRGASVASRRSPKVTGKLPPSWGRSGSGSWSRRWSRRDRWTGRCFGRM